jgi:hypothetical protein
VTAIVEELGRRLHIAVTVSDQVEKPVTVAFDKLSVEEALERLKAVADIDYFIAYRKVSPTRAEQITRIEVVAKGTGAMGQPPTPGTVTPAVSPAQGQEERGPGGSFGFEFDRLCCMNTRKPNLFKDLAFLVIFRKCLKTQAF